MTQLTLQQANTIVEKAFANAQQYLSGNGLPQSDTIYMPAKSAA